MDAGLWLGVTESLHQEEAHAALTKAAEDMARWYNAHRGPTPEYRVGQKVWLSAEDITTTRPMKKLDNKWLGPYAITKKVYLHFCDHESDGRRFYIVI